ncbi:sporulation integral membrane protein YtvI [Bacillus litorisediminis]|uniref:sporulation integral membrane protein YtvI n=1 Tax=Bacillus litorisediminis TaxID=2922713 RepID=UPI001FAE7115|nr:sporulation integral membrane protein YtvI [Bacillus litorisediminis]
MNPIHLYRTIRFFFVIGAIIFGTILFFYISQYTYPFIIGLIIAFCMNPFVNFLHHKARFPRTFSVILTLLLFFSMFIGLLTLLITEIISGTTYLADVVPRHLEITIDYIEYLIASQIIPLYNQLTDYFNSLDASQQQTILTNIENVGSKIADSVSTFVTNVLESIPSILTWFPNAATVLVFSLLSTFFISKDWNKLTALFSGMLPKKAKESGKNVFLDLQKALGGFIRAQATLISITTVIVLIGLLILRVDYAITIALIIGLADILPYLGTGLIFVPWIIFELVGGNPNLGVGLIVLYVIVVVQRQLMEPKILSSSIGLDPLATLIALFVGFQLIGFLGLILGPIFLVIFNTFQRTGVFGELWEYIKGKDESIKR